MKKSTYFVIIIAVLLIGLVVYRIIPHSLIRPNQNNNNSQVNSANDNLNNNNDNANTNSDHLPPDWQTYVNNQYNFSLSYPKSFTLNASATDSIFGWDYFNGNSLAQQVAAVTIPRSIQPKTNFGEAVFSVNVGKQTMTADQCLVSDQLKPTGKQKTISGLNFVEATTTDAGAGNYYEVTNYRALYHDYCWSLDLMIHSSNIQNYDPSQGIKPYDHDLVFNQLEQMLETFNFTD